MTDFDRLILIVMPLINVALGVIGVLIGMQIMDWHEAFARMAWLCGFAIVGDIGIFGLSRLWLWAGSA